MTDQAPSPPPVRAAFPPRRASTYLSCALYAALLLMWLFDTASAVSNATTLGNDFEILPVISGTMVTALLLVPDTWLAPVPRAVAASAVSWALTLGLLFVSEGAPSSWGVLESASLLLLLARTARHAAPRSAVVLCVALGSATIAAPLRLRGGIGYDVLSWAFLLTFAVGAAVGLGCHLRSLDRRRTQAVLEVRQSERLALARDLHDSVAHHATGIVVQAQAARTVRESAPEQVEPLLEAIEQAGVETLESMRRLVRVMREEEGPAVLPGEVFAVLRDMIADYNRDGGPACTLRVPSEVRGAQLAPEVNATAQRAVQEALTNVRRHAPTAPSVTVEAAPSDGKLWLQVGNSPADGPGNGPVGGRGGLGLIGLRERVEAVGGTLSAGPDSDGGWRLAVLLPVRGMGVSAP